MKLCLFYDYIILCLNILIIDIFASFSALVTVYTCMKMYMVLTHIILCGIAISILLPEANTHL